MQGARPLLALLALSLLCYAVMRRIAPAFDDLGRVGIAVVVSIVSVRLYRTFRMRKAEERREGDRREDERRAEED